MYWMVDVAWGVFFGAGVAILWKMYWVLDDIRREQRRSNDLALGSVERKKVIRREELDQYYEERRGWCNLFGSIRDLSEHLGTHLSEISKMQDSLLTPKQRRSIHRPMKDTPANEEAKHVPVDPPTKKRKKELQREMTRAHGMFKDRLKKDKKDKS